MNEFSSFNPVPEPVPRLSAILSVAIVSPVGPIHSIAVIAGIACRTEPLPIQPPIYWVISLGYISIHARCDSLQSWHSLHN